MLRSDGLNQVGVMNFCMIQNEDQTFAGIVVDGLLEKLAKPFAVGPF